MPKWLHHAPGGHSAARSVFIATPVYGSLPPLYSFCLFESALALKEAGYSVELGILVDHCHVDDARNQIIRDFLVGTCEQLVFIDADIGWSPQSLLKLLAHDREVVAATYPLKQDQENYPARLIPGEIWSDSDGLIEVEGVPAGFLKISRSALLKLASSKLCFWYSEQVGDSDAPLIFERGIWHGTRFSGDYTFCNKHRIAGGKVYVDPDIYLEHQGSNTWSGTFGSFLRRKNGLALTKQINTIKKHTEIDTDIVSLVMDWGNIPYAAGGELIKSVISTARQVRGHVIEFGSGLSTIAMAAANQDIQIWAVEHDLEWLQKTEAAVDRLELRNVHIIYSPLKDGWYSNVQILPWRLAEMVLCDGPPRWEGNRNKLFDVMRETKCRPKVILYDDTNIEDEELNRWAKESGYYVTIMGECKKFACLIRSNMSFETKDVMVASA